MSYLKEAANRLTKLLLGAPEDDETRTTGWLAFHEATKMEILESYRNGQKAGMKEERPSREATRPTILVSSQTEINLRARVVSFLAERNQRSSTLVFARVAEAAAVAGSHPPFRS